MSFSDRCCCCFAFVVAIFIISLNSVYCEDLLELACLTDRDCTQFEISGINVTCNAGSCQCTNVSGDSKECKPKDLRHTNIIGGPCPCNMPNAECKESENICYCAKNFTASPDKRRCLADSVNLDEACELDYQCHAADHHSICDKNVKKCICRRDFVAINGTCVSVPDPNTNCHTDENCQRYGGHVTCSMDVYKCICDDGYIKALNKLECINVMTYLGNCTEDEQCQAHMGPGSACIKKVCECDNDHFLVKQDLQTDDKVNVTQSVCARIVEIGNYCLVDRDCYHQMLPDEDQTMSCLYGECNCKWGYNSINNRECTKGSNGNLIKPMLKSVILLLLVFIGI